MDTDQFEALLEGAQESDVLEFKTSMSWSPSLIRDILAMANVQDGGRIVIGIEDQSHERKGVTREQILTFNQEVIQDRVATYADPQVEFRVEVVTDRAGLSFIVIEVRPFDTIPVICRRDGDGLNEGDIYYRSRVGRPSSARVKRSPDMRDIIEVAIARSRNRLVNVGLVSQQDDHFNYDDELGGL